MLVNSIRTLLTQLVVVAVVVDVGRLLGGGRLVGRLEQVGPVKSETNG